MSKSSSPIPERGTALRSYARIAAAAAAVAGLGFAAPAAHAQAATGYLEICKRSAATNPVSGTFSFRIDNNATPVVVGTGGCSAPIQVAAGNHTVTEVANDWTAVTATRTIPQERLVSSNLATRADVVSVPAGDISSTVTVEYTNQAQYGTLEICKSAQAGSGFSGSASFRELTVPVGACSQSFDVPAGDQVEVDEIGPNAVNLVGITTVRSGDLLASNLSLGTSRLRVRAGGVDNETIATFVNGTSRLKICKVAGTPTLAGTVYSFTANGETVSAVAQAAPGGCVLVDRAFAGGTRVDIQEGIVPGTGTSAISVSNNRAIAGTTDLANRKVSVILGSGETVVTYTNQVVAPSLLKVCKNAGPGVTVGQVFSFAVSGRTDPLLVPAGYCAIAGTFTFNSTVTVTEAASAGLAVNAVAAFPSGQLVNADLAGRIARVLVGASVTEVAFTNATAGTPATAPTIGSSPSSTNNAPTNLPSTTGSTLGGTTPTPVIDNHGGSTTPAGIPADTCRLEARLVPRYVQVAKHLPHGAFAGSERRRQVGLTLVITARGNASVCNVVIRQLGLHGVTVASTSKKLKVGKTYRIKLSNKAKRVRTSIAK
jgi:hypothetical protein